MRDMRPPCLSLARRACPALGQPQDPADWLDFAGLALQPKG